MNARARFLFVAVGLALLAPAARVLAQNSFTWAIADRGAVNELNFTATFHTDIINTGTVTDTYRITLLADMPGTWLTTLCDEGLCYPPFITTLDYTVAPGDTLYVGINITPMFDSGTGASTVTVSSLDVPALTHTAVFSVLTPGNDVLVVDADGIAAAPVAVFDAVAAAGRSMSTWNRDASGTLSATELASFAAIVWHAGDYPFGLDVDDRTALSNYVAGGGRVLLSGANLAFLTCDPLSAWYDPAAVVWFADLFGVGYAANAGGGFQVTGMAGDPVGGGLSFAVNDGGANGLPDVLTAQGGITSLLYDGGGVAGVRRQSGAGRTLFLGFGCAGIADTASRNAFVAAALDWLTDVVSSVPPLFASGGPGLAAAPNPFNPSTTVWVTNDGPPVATSTLDVYDLRGRRVRALRRGPLAEGRTAVAWDGRDDAGRALPAGPYLARLAIPGANGAMIKLMLAK